MCPIRPLIPIGVIKTCAAKRHAVLKLRRDAGGKHFAESVWAAIAAEQKALHDFTTSAFDCC